MNIVVAAVGRAKPGAERDLFDSYAGRLPWRVDLKEIEIKKESALDVRRAREGEALLAAVPEGARIVAFPGHRDPSKYQHLSWVRDNWRG